MMNGLKTLICLSITLKNSPKELAEKEYDKFNVKRLRAEASADDDFEKAVRLVEEKEKHKGKK